MCESTVYSMDGVKIMEDVISIKINDDIIDLADILNQKKQLNGNIVEIDLDKHSIYVDLKKIDFGGKKIIHLKKNWKFLF